MIFTVCSSYITFTPNGNFLLCSALDSTIRIWDIKKGTCPITINEPTYINERYCLTPCFYTRNGDGDEGPNYVVSGSENSLLHVWDISNAPGQCVLKKKISTITHGDEGGPNKSATVCGLDERPILALDICQKRSLLALSVLDDRHPNLSVFRIVPGAQHG